MDESGVGVGVVDVGGSGGGGHVSGVRLRHGASLPLTCDRAPEPRPVRGSGSVHLYRLPVRVGHLHAVPLDDVGVLVTAGAEGIREDVQVGGRGEAEMHSRAHRSGDRRAVLAVQADLPGVGGIRRPLRGPTGVSDEPE